MQTRLKIQALAIALATIGSSCDSTNPSISGAAGPYRGVVTFSDSGRSREFLVQGTASTVSTSITVQVVPSGSEPPFEITGKFSPARDQVELSAAALFDGARSLPAEADDCYLKDLDRVCYDGHAFLINLASTRRGLLSLVLEKYDGAPLQLEAPAAFTTDQLRDRGMARNFDTRIEYEHVVQAKLMARNAHLNLLPHLSFNTFFSLISMDLTALIRSVGDLAPFLLPTRWMKADQATQVATAEAYAWLAMKADTASVVEGMAFTVLRDEGAIAVMKEQRALIEQLRDQVRGQEDLGIVARGASDQITTLLDGTDLSINLLSQTLSEEYTALALATGFMNPHAVAQVTAGALPSAASPDPIDEGELSQVALLRSLELRQMSALIAQARSSRTQRIFSWTDPSGESAGALGFGLLDYVRTGSSQVNELEIRREKLKAIQLQKAANAITEARVSAKAFKLASADVDLQRRQLDRLQGNMALGIRVSVLELVTALQARMKSVLDVNNAEFAYYNARAKIDRLTLAGPYSSVGR